MTDLPPIPSPSSADDAAEGAHPDDAADHGSFEVEPRWKEQVFYWEGDRGFLFDAGWGVEPPVLYVPPADEWDACTPVWMHGRRDLIIARLETHSRHRLAEGPYPVTQRGLTRDV